MKRIHVLALIVITFLNSCANKPTIEGLWIVTSVTAGDQEITPNARWTRFNPDFTQESGNGWLQHSFGTWKLNPKTNELSIVNSNGLNDLNEPFKVTINQNSMAWNRIEEGQAIKVFLTRSNHLPETYGDKLLGLWRLEEAIGNENYFKESDKAKTSNYIFFKWDKRFVIGSEKGRIHGVYNVHGHKSEVELIPYDNQYKRGFWKIDFDENTITLRLLNTDSTVTRKFKRIHEFPQ